MNKLVLSVVALVCLFLSVTANAQWAPTLGVHVDVAEVTGLDASGNIPWGGVDLSIPVRFTNAYDARTAISNGYFFNSSEVTIDSMSVEWNPAYPWNNYLAFTVHMCYPPVCYSWFDQGDWFTPIYKGLGGFGIAALTGINGLGLPADFDDVAYTFDLMNVEGPPGAVLTMDTTWWEPGNFWLWSGVGSDVFWGGPYEFAVVSIPCWEGPYTTCWPQPVELGVNDNDRVLQVNIYCENVMDVDLASVQVFGKIPCYTNDGVAWIEGDVIVTDAFLMRFLGSGGFRPLDPNGIISTYFVTYEIYGVPTTLTGDFVMMVNQADVTFDGVAGIDDIIFMTEHLFGGGPGCELDGYPMPEIMDVDQSGRFDLLDIRALIEIVY